MASSSAFSPISAFLLDRKKRRRSASPYGEIQKRERPGTPKSTSQVTLRPVALSCSEQIIDNFVADPSTLKFQNSFLKLSATQATKYVILKNDMHVQDFLREVSIQKQAFEQTGCALPTLHCEVFMCSCSEAPCGHDRVGCVSMPRAEMTLRDYLCSDAYTTEQKAAKQLEALQCLRAIAGVGIRHGDVKTNNFVIAADGHVKIIDFGLASRDDQAMNIFALHDNASVIFKDELITWTFRYCEEDNTTQANIAPLWVEVANYLLMAQPNSHPSHKLFSQFL